MNIEVGEYIRDRAGNIRKVSRTMPIYENDLLLSNSYYIEFDNLGNVETYRSSYIEEIMTKHSHNIIDLIEHGDLVKFKGWGATKGIDVIDMRIDEEVNLLFADAEFCDGWTEIEGKKYMIYDLNYLVGKDQSNKIDWILTHEQITNNCYRLED